MMMELRCKGLSMVGCSCSHSVDAHPNDKNTRPIGRASTKQRPNNDQTIGASNTNFQAYLRRQNDAKDSSGDPTIAPNLVRRSSSEVK